MRRVRGEATAAGRPGIIRPPWGLRSSRTAGICGASTDAALHLDDAAQHFAESLAPSQSCLAADAFFACEMPVNTARAIYGITLQSIQYFSRVLLSEMCSIFNYRKYMYTVVFPASLCSTAKNRKGYNYNTETTQYAENTVKEIRTKYGHLEQNCKIMIKK